MFERFTTEARQVVMAAQDEARALRHASIGTEHLLIALTAGDGIAAQVLTAHDLSAAGLRQRLLMLTEPGLDPEALALLGIDLDRVKEATEAQLGPGALERTHRPPVKDGHLPFSKDAKKTLELGLREAQLMKSTEFRSGHLLLGLLRTADGLAGQLLREAQLEPEDLRAEVTSLISAEAA